MPGKSQPSAEIENPKSDTWPWRCLDCGTGIYHDGDYCLACGSAQRLVNGDKGYSASDGFMSWMRDEPLPTFVIKTTVITGIELGLTTFWLLLILQRFVEISVPLPVMG